MNSTNTIINGKLLHAKDLYDHQINLGELQQCSGSCLSFETVDWVLKCIRDRDSNELKAKTGMILYFDGRCGYTRSEWNNLENKKSETASLNPSGVMRESKCDGEIPQVSPESSDLDELLVKYFIMQLKECRVLAIIAPEFGATFLRIASDHDNKQFIKGKQARVCGKVFPSTCTQGKCLNDLILSECDINGCNDFVFPLFCVPSLRNWTSPHHKDRLQTGWKAHLNPMTGQISIIVPKHGSKKIRAIQSSLTTIQLVSYLASDLSSSSLDW